MKVGFEHVPQTPEVLEAKKNLKDVSSLPADERRKKDAEVAAIQRVFEDQVAAKAPKKGNTLLDKIREAEKKKSSSSKLIKDVLLIFPLWPGFL